MEVEGRFRRFVVGAPELEGSCCRGVKEDKMEGRQSKKAKRRGLRNDGEPELARGRVSEEVTCERNDGEDEVELRTRRMEMMN